MIIKTKIGIQLIISFKITIQIQVKITTNPNSCLSLHDECAYHYSEIRGLSLMK